MNTKIKLASLFLAATVATQVQGAEYIHKRDVLAKTREKANFNNDPAYAYSFSGHKDLVKLNPELVRIKRREKTGDTTQVEVWNRNPNVYRTAKGKLFTWTPEEEYLNESFWTDSTTNGSLRYNASGKKGYSTHRDSKYNLKINSDVVKFDGTDPHQFKVKTTETGKGVKIGITDSGFNNAENRKLAEKDGLKLTKLYDTNSDATVTHGYDVAKTVKTYAPNAEIYARDLGNGDRNLADDAKLNYMQMFNDGVRIFNNSFSSAQKVSQYEDYTPFYTEDYNEMKEIIEKGGLFIFAGGNDKANKGGLESETTNETRMQGVLPYYDGQFEKGFLNVIGLWNGHNHQYNDKTLKLENIVPTQAVGTQARNWTLAASAYEDGIAEGSLSIGSSFAAPKVAAAAALVKEKYPFMTGDLLRQTLLSTATDIGEVGVDNQFGWGMLNVEKALDGPALFAKRLALGDYVNVHFNNDMFAFGNNIAGDAGLNKTGNGVLLLVGENTYTGDTLVKDGVLVVSNKMNSTIYNNARTIAYNLNARRVVNNALLELHQNVNLGELKTEEASTLITRASEKVRINKAFLKSMEKYKVVNDKYVPKTGENLQLLQIDEIEGKFDTIETGKNFNVVATNETGTEVHLSRKDMVAENDTTTERTVIDNLNNTFNTIDNNLSTTNTEILEKSVDILNERADLETLSGEIYASMQNITFEHLDNLNQEIDNRISNIDLKETEGGAWVSTLGSKGELKKDKYLSADTKTHSVQFGIDKKITDNTLVGIAYHNGETNLDFGKGGVVKGEVQGITVYGKTDINDNLYIQARAGYAESDNDLVREVNTGDIEKVETKFEDKALSFGTEIGYHMNLDKIKITPYIGIEHTEVKRGEIKEDKDFGIESKKTEFSQTNLELGVKAQGNITEKLSVNAYVNTINAIDSDDLEFNGNFKGVENSDIKVKGINLSEHKVGVGVGATYKTEAGIDLFANYDVKVAGNGRDNHMGTVGIRYNF